MIISTIYRVFIPFDEFDAMLEFESHYKNYIKIKEDTTGVTYEYRSDCTVKFQNGGLTNDEVTVEGYGRLD